MSNRQVGAAVKARRLIRRLSMREAAKIGGISVSAWSELEQDRHEVPSYATQRAVAAALDWPLDWWDRLAAGEDVPTVAGQSADAWAGPPAAETVDERLDRIERMVRASAATLTRLDGRVDVLLEQAEQVAAQLAVLAEQVAALSAERSGTGRARRAAAAGRGAPR
jgi:transcriptional regulator with XRE-family HTH domain